MAARHGLVKAAVLARVAAVGARDDDEVEALLAHLVARGERGADARDRRRARLHRQPPGVRAPLREELVLNRNARKAGRRVASHRAPDVAATAKAGVAVADDRQLAARRVAQLLADGQLLAVANQPCIGHGELRRRDGVSGHEGDLEAGALN